MTNLTIEIPTESLDVRTRDGRRFPTELLLDLTGPNLSIYVPRDEDDESYALDSEPNRYGVQDMTEDGRVYWTIPLMATDKADRFLSWVADEARKAVAGADWSNGYLDLSQAACDALDRIAARCSSLRA